jgi:large subunit ribosomal protein L22
MSKRERNKATERREHRESLSPHARLTGIRMSARKIRAVAAVIEGKSVTEALSTLSVSLRLAARPLRKLISSAVANAAQKGLEDLDALTVTRVEVDGGQVQRRFMPRAMGRATRIRKQSAHVTVWLSGNKD